MQEFESVSASSYDPSALAAKLTAKAAEGWSVVAIVPTGGDVTAFLSRGAGSVAAAESPAVVAAAAAAAEATPEPAAEPTPEPVAEIAPEPVAEIAPEPAAAVSEPAGWAVAPESTTTAAEPATTYQPTTYQPAASQPAASQPAAQQAATYQPTIAVSTPAAAATPTVPAGWYADPAGRYELRYWDGNAWTEHVSRAGQQFTDPPVA